MMGWSNYSMGGAGWLVMTLFMVGFWTLVIAALAVIFRGTRSDGPPAMTGRRDPVDILDERLARGEIDSDEYQARKAALRRVT